MRARNILVVGTAAIVSLAITVPATAGQRDESDPIEERSGYARDIGRVILKQFTDTSRTYANLVTTIAPDTESADEWDLFLHRDGTCTSPITSYPFIFTEAYGTRVNAFEPTPPYTLTPGPDQAITAELVHEGPNFQGHAGSFGRHSVACITLEVEGR